MSYLGNLYPVDTYNTYYTKPTFMKDSTYKTFTTMPIPEGVTQIGSGVFKDATALTELTIPNSVSTVYDKSFYNCRKLKTNVFPENCSISNGCQTFYYCQNLTNCPPYVDENCTNMYQTFYYCTNLSGEIYINSKNIMNAYQCFMALILIKKK